MKILRVLVPAVALAACSSFTPAGSTRTISGRLTATHPAGTAVLAVGKTGRMLAPLAADGAFVVKARSTDTYALKFVLDRQVLGTILRSNGTPLKIGPGATAVDLGSVGTSAQALTAAPTAPAGDCSDLGEPVEAENESEVAEASEVQDAPEAIEPESESATEASDGDGLDSQHENTDACGQNEEGEH